MLGRRRLRVTALRVLVGPEFHLHRATSASPTTASAPPATGKLVETDLLTYRIPTSEWETRNKSGTSAGLIDPSNGGIWLLAESEDVILREEARTLGQLAEYDGVGDTSYFDPALVRGENRVVGGVEGYTASAARINKGERSLDSSVFVWGGSVGDRSVYFELSGLNSDSRTRKWFDAVLASVTWK